MLRGRIQKRRPAGKILPVLALSSLVATAALGAGTPAGTTIMNQALASYRSAEGGPMPPVLSNIVSMTVRQAAAVNITPAAASRASQVNTTVDFPLTVTNSGNGTDNLLLSEVSSHGLAAALYRDLNNDGVIEQAESAAGMVQQTGPLQADSSLHLVARLAIPADGSLNGQTDVLTVAATSLFDGRVHASATYTTLISSAALSLTVSVNNTVPLGGDRVTYTLAYLNAGSAPASGVVMTDQLHHLLRYVTSSSSPPPAAVSGQALTWSLGTVPAGAAGAITFQADLVNNAAPGTEIHNAAQVQYSDGPNMQMVGSAEKSFITVQAGGAATVDVGPAPAGSGEPGDTMRYALTVINNGALPESFALSAVSSLGLSWTFFLSAAGNGTADSGEIATTTTGTIPGGGGRCLLLARAILPVVQTDRATDETVFTVTSNTSAANHRSTTGTTTIGIPVVTLTKTADAPDPESGGEIRYQISFVNSGSGHAFQFAIQDSIPATSTYVPGSVTLNTVQRTDEADGDEVQVSGGLITARLAVLPPHQSGILAFRVRIN